MIKIHQGKIFEVEDKAVMATDIEIDGAIKTVQVSVAKEYGKFLSPERADYALIGMLRYALLMKHDITCDAPVTEQLLYNVTQILIPTLIKSDARNFPVKIFAKTAPPLEKLDFTDTLNKKFSFAKNDDGNFSIEKIAEKNFGAVGTGLSCGVDSFYTLLKHYKSAYPNMNLTHIVTFESPAFTVNYKKYPQTKSEIYFRAERVAADLNLSFVKVGTNFAKVLPQHYDYSHTYTSMLPVYAMQKLWKIYYYAGSDPLSLFTLENNLTKPTGYFELLLLDCFSTPNLKIISSGSEVSRKDKVEFIADFPIVQKNIHVCTVKGDCNCGVCGKCMRTLFDLDALNRLDDFKESFDIDDYRKNIRGRYRYLYRHCVVRKNPFLKEAYEILSERHKDVFKVAAAEVQAELEKKAT